VSIPLAVFFGLYLEWGLPGMWFGYGIGLLLLNFLYASLILKSSDWHLISLQIQRDMLERTAT